MAALMVLATAALAAPLAELAARPTVSSDFRVSVNGCPYDWSDIGRFVLPGETLDLAVLGLVAHSGFVASDGELIEDGSRARWVAPAEPGAYGVMVTGGEQVRRLNIFVMVPFESLKAGRLCGVTIGRYPAENLFPNFTRPKGFIVVTPDLMEVKVSPRYTLGEFVPHQPECWPRYIVLREELLVKLEALTDYVQAKGHRFDKFHIISGFRAPYYNQRNRSGRNSAHVYGGAADFYVDGDNNGMMDDLNRDGVVNRRDAKLLAEYVDEFELGRPELVGGCGWYSRTRYRGPFIHVDVRGAPVRWHQ